MKPEFGVRLATSYSDGTTGTTKRPVIGQDPTQLESSSSPSALSSSLQSEVEGAKFVAALEVISRPKMCQCKVSSEFELALWRDASSEC